MKKSMLAIGLMLFALSGKAQIVVLEWAKSISGNESSKGYFIANDASGNVYVVGEFRGTMDFDPSASVYNLTSQGQTDGFVQKLDVNGNLVWAKSISGTSYNYCNSIAIDPNGDLIIGGSFSGPTDFDPSSSANIVNSVSNVYDLFTLKLNALGDLVWVKTTGGNYSERSQEIALDASGNIFTIGTYSGTSDFDPSASSANLSTNSVGDVDVFLQKLDNDGNFIWIKSLGQMHNGIGYSVAIGPLNEIVVTGQFNETVDLDPGPDTLNFTSNGQYDVFIQKFFPNGDLQWARTFGGTGDDIGLSVKIGITGKIYLVGTFENNIDFNPNGSPILASSNGSSDIFIEQIEGNGNVSWVRTIGGVALDYASSVSLDQNEFLYVTGSYGSTVDFDPSSSTAFEITTQGGADIFIDKFANNGDFIWAKSAGGPQAEIGTCILAQNNGTLHVTGAFQGVADFDPDLSVFNLTSNGGNNAFVQKLSVNENSNVSIIEITSKNIELWPNPSNGLVNLSLGDVENANLCVYNLMGQLVYSQYNLNKIVQIELPLKNGNYILEINHDNKVERIRVLLMD